MKASTKATKAPRRVLSAKRAPAVPTAGKPRAARKTKPKDLPGDAAVRRLKKLIEHSLDEDKAEDVAALDLRGKSSLADWMILATGRSSRQVSAISEHLLERLRKETGRTYRSEGKHSGDWVVIDAGDIIVHIFQPDTRAFYNLEKMWSVHLPDQEAV